MLILYRERHVVRAILCSCFASPRRLLCSLLPCRYGCDLRGFRDLLLRELPH